MHAHEKLFRAVLVYLQIVKAFKLTHCLYIYMCIYYNVWMYKQKFNVLLWGTHTLDIGGLIQHIFRQIYEGPMW